MRVLIAVALAGCYSPGVDDCQFRCGTRMACPEGTECRDGVCRTDPSTACPGTPGCPAQPSGCDPPITLDGAVCATTCSQTRTRSEAAQLCDGGPGSPWRLAVLDSAARLDGLDTTGGRYWTGGVRNNGDWRWGFNGPAIAGECWAPSNPGNGDDCAFVDGAQKRLSNGASCNDRFAVICTTQ